MVERIYIVDDERNMASAIARTLERCGYTCNWFTDAESALAAFEKEPADLVLTDQRMPGMDGIEFMRQLHRIKANLPVILITAFGGIASAVKAMKEGAFDYVTKPFDNTELRALVGRALRLDHLERENRELRHRLNSSHRAGIIAQSDGMRAVLDLADRAATSKATVLITGESGTGKEVVARQLHFQSERVGRPFLAVNCKAFAEGVLESELFGHEKGAFTGAHSERMGCFERARGGTLFLDEIGETNGAFQAKLLRVLQESEVLRVGGTSPRKVDVRIVAATNRNLRDQVAKSEFREDLFFRLNVIPIHIPPLRERRDDILPLVHHFLEKQMQVAGKRLSLSSEAQIQILNHSWPGNVRELENSIERAAVLAKSEAIGPEDLLLEPGLTVGLKEEENGGTLQEAMDQAAEARIRRALQACGNRKAEAAATLGIDRTTLYRFMKKLGMV